MGCPRVFKEEGKTQMTDEREEAQADQGDMERKRDREEQMILGHKVPRYLLLSKNGSAYSYWDPVILRCDYAANPTDVENLLKARSEMGRLYYHPITIAELKEER